MANRSTEYDLDVVRLEASGRAKAIIATGHTLLPFAITLTDDAELFSHELSPDAAEGSSTALEILALGVRAGIAGGNPRAVALVRHVTLHDFSDSERMQAVCIAAEHRDGSALRYFLPYETVGGVVSWGQERRVPAVPWCFPERGV